VEYYKEFQVRLGPLVLEYFGKPEDNRTVIGMIWHGYPVVRWTLFCLVIWAGFVWLTRRLVRRDTAGTTWPARLIATLVLVAVTAIGSRGGIQRTPLRWGDAYFSQNTYANHMAGNGAYLLMDTVRNHNKSYNSASWRRALPATNAVAIAREITLQPGDTLFERRQVSTAPPRACCRQLASPAKGPACGAGDHGKFQRALLRGHRREVRRDAKLR
jgi:hypothetical protein